MSEKHKYSKNEEMSPLDQLLLGLTVAVGVTIAKTIWEEKRGDLLEWLRERQRQMEYARSEEGLREQVDAMHEFTRARAYAAKKSFDALVEAGFTEEQAFQILAE